MGTFLKHTSCPCGSSDGLGVYQSDEDGHHYGKCFVCGQTFPQLDPDDSISKPTGKGTTPMIELSKLEYGGELEKTRKIKPETQRRWSYGYGEHKGEKVQVANYMGPDGAPVFQKLRYPDKQFRTAGDASEPILYGSHLFSKTHSKRCVIVEGEIDAMSFDQALKGNVPVFSVPFGAQAAAKAITHNILMLDKFDQVVLAFDNDKPGREAFEACTKLLRPGVVHQVDLGGHKDANEALMKSGERVLLNAMQHTKAWVPDGIVRPEEIRELAMSRPNMGLSWGLSELDDLLYGIQKKKLIGIGAGPGTGKTTVTAGIALNHLLVNKQPVGCLFYETPPEDMLKIMAGQLVSKDFLNPNASWSPDDLGSAIDTIIAANGLYMNSGFEVTKWSDVRTKIRHLVVSCNCKLVILDHLTLLTSGLDNVNDELHDIMAEMASMVHSLDFTLVFVSHLKTPVGTPHEEGGRVKGADFYGSRAMYKFADVLFGLERNQQALEEDARMVVTFRMLKVRYHGAANGSTFCRLYDPDKTTLYPIDPDTWERLENPEDTF